MVGGQTLQGIVTSFKFLWYYNGETYPIGDVGRWAVLDLDWFILEEIAIAPKHPLAQNLDLPIPNANSASPERKFERFITLDAGMRALDRAQPPWLK